MAERSERTGLTDEEWHNLSFTLADTVRIAFERGKAHGYAQGLSHGYSEGYHDGITHQQPKQYAPNDTVS